MKTGIIGFGFVGKATYQFDNSIIVYDINKELCIPKNITINDIYLCDIIFVCVPTPMNADGSVYLNIINDVINELKKNVNSNSSIIIRSTVPPGTCDNLDVFFMPEFLTEKNYLNDFVNNKNWIIGTPRIYNEIQINNIKNLIINSKIKGNIKYDLIKILNNKEAEMVKYFKNVFLSVKVSFCNEIFEYCKEKQIDYNNVIENVCLDERINKSHTSVPGPDGKYGFGGTCFPKDCSGLLYEFSKNNLESYIIKGAIERNNEKDRKEQDWKLSKGRAVVKN
uniref:Uncharacterized protein n=1 Tax=Mimiviridae sp. ChoanoV1 TaxID=2596887 RepID=A0A5B8HXX9_9VIRU|nr:hypothetical protein 3_69 [Mimiviridae sp. ChoanoV1]